jgi:hypothetical protein
LIFFDHCLTVSEKDRTVCGAAQEAVTLKKVEVIVRNRTDHLLGHPGEGGENEGGPRFDWRH